MGKRLMILAGGTGGHVFPGLAVAGALGERGYEIVWMGTRGGIEGRLVPEAGYPIEWVKVSGFRGRGVVGWMLAPFKLMLAVYQALKIVLRVKPDLVLGMGGFVTGPGGIAAWLTRCDLVLHEQNAVAGMANRLLAPFAARLMEGFTGSFQGRKKVVVTGNPVRCELLGLPTPDERLLGRKGALRLLVIGGSQGAVALNSKLPLELSEMVEQGRLIVRHQAGERNLSVAKQAYSDVGVEAEVISFIDDMAEAYQWADVVICRAGALTLAELSAVGVASILVPFPFAVDDHQTRNAEHLAAASAAYLCPQQEIGTGVIGEWLTELHANRKKLISMASAARKLSSDLATDLVVEVCIQLLDSDAQPKVGGGQ